MQCPDMTVSEVLSDPLIASVMAADAVDRAELAAMLQTVARSIASRRPLARAADAAPRRFGVPSAGALESSLPCR